MQTKANVILTLKTPNTGDWVLLTNLQKIIGAVLYDPASPDYNKQESLIVRSFPYGRALVKLKWSQFVTEEDLLKEAKDEKGNKIPDSKMFSSPRRFLGSNLMVATREEWVNLRQFEQHPFVAEVTSGDGAYMEFVVLVTYEITNPILAVSCPDIFEYAIGFMSQEFRSWAGKTENTYRNLRSRETDGSGVPCDVEKEIWKLNGDIIHTDSATGEEWAEKAPINPNPAKRKKFEKFGFRIDSMSISLIALSAESSEFRESEEKIAIETNNVAVAVETQKILMLQNVAQEKRNDTELKFREKDAQIRTNLINSTADALYKANKGWTEGSVTHLFFGSGSPNVQTGNLVSDLAQVQDFADHDTDDRRKPKNTGGNK